MTAALSSQAYRQPIASLSPAYRLDLFTRVGVTILDAPLNRRLQRTATLPIFGNIKRLFSG
jgi:hypothetical protein